MMEALRTAFNEDTRVKFPATIHFLRLGYQYRSYNKALEEGKIDFKTKIFIDSFKRGISKINGRDFSDEEIKTLIDKIHSVISNNDLGKEFYSWLINPIDKARLIDFKNIDNNVFEVVNELKFGEQDEGHFRPDINILINGIPLAFLEVKKPNNEGGIQVEFDRMVNKRYEQIEHRKYFNMIQLTCFSNNMPYETDDDRESEPKQGSFYSTPNGSQTTFNFFREESKEEVPLLEDNLETIESLLIDNGYAPEVMNTPEYMTNIAINTPCNSFVTSLFEKTRLLYLLQYGIVYVDEDVVKKHIMRYPQFFASQAILKRIKNGGKSGIIWHTQGSGKTELAVYVNRIIRDYYADLGVNARFFYVVDRLELLNQTKAAFEMRGVEAVSVDSKEAFINELNRSLDKKRNQSAFGTCCVVNIQKFSDSLPEAANDYNAKTMRVFFIDEAHRSYSKGTGEFYKNLMLVDRDAIFLAMTGTPLLSKKERSNLRFGEYIHKYFYDRSILDGYTLKIKKEEMETIAKADIKMNLELELKGKRESEKAKILESDEYVASLAKYIENDFKNFRYTNGDPSIGGMIVCNSNPQAAKMQKWFEKNSTLNTRLVTDEVPSEVNKESQKDFKTAKNGIDLLIVNLMLTTGYDVPRLKKMYLLRAPREHSLLQTISRVNRPYKSPNGKTYQYGYISDFVDITEEYDRTVAQYLKELNEELTDPDDPTSANGGKLVFDINEIERKYEDALSKLKDIQNHDNLEDYNNFLTRIPVKEPLYRLRKLINTILDCKTEFLLSHEDEKATQIDRKHFKELAKLVQHRIDFLNLAGNPIQTMDFLSEKEVVELLFEFVKVRTVILDMKNIQAPDDIKGKIERLAKEVKKLKNHDDEEVITLDELLRKTFEKLSFNNVDDLNALSDELKTAIEKAQKINAENERLTSELGGEFAYVKTYQDLCKNHPEFEKEKVLEFMKIISEAVTGIKSVNNLVLLGRTNFIANIKKQTSGKLLKSGLYSELRLNKLFDTILSNLFVNLQLY
ncbi:MAG: DEAD/DEAH box helicase family protein [Candidatus Enteromonas sp.]|nr:DEAD/DEAH box helicase family protein [Candidatus Enteromonas sp.]